MNGDLMEMKIDVVPAHPGWFVLDPWRVKLDGEIGGFTREAVIAWRVETDRSVVGEVYSMAFPVTAEYVSGDDGILLRPDGIISFSGDRAFENEADALEYARESVRAKTAKR